MSPEKESRTSRLKDTIANLYVLAFNAFLSFEGMKEFLDNEWKEKLQKIEVPEEGITLFIAPTIDPAKIK